MIMQRRRNHFLVVLSFAWQFFHYATTVGSPISLSSSSFLFDHAPQFPERRRIIILRLFRDKQVWESEGWRQEKKWGSFFLTPLSNGLCTISSLYKDNNCCRGRIRAGKTQEKTGCTWKKSHSLSVGNCSIIGRWEKKAGIGFFSEVCSLLSRIVQYRRRYNTRHPCKALLQLQNCLTLAKLPSVSS